MHRHSYAESHAMDADMSRAASRVGSISTLWSSAEIPLCLDPRVQDSSDSFEQHPYKGHSVAGSISRASARSSQITMDFGRLSIDIPDEYPRRPESIRLTPPRSSGSESTSSSNPSSRVPSFNIGTIDEDTAMLNSPMSKMSYQPPNASAQPRILSSRFSEDTIDEPQLPHSASQGTFGKPMSLSRKSSALSDALASESARSSCTHQDTDLQSQSRGMQGFAQAPPSDLYRRAYRFFDKDYSVQPSAELSAPTSFSAADVILPNDDPLFQRPSLSGNGSELSHESSLQSCSRSQGSTQASTNSASTCSDEGFPARNAVFQPTVADNRKAEAFLSPTSTVPVIKGESLLLLRGQNKASYDERSDSLSIPSLPSLPSFSSHLTATYAHHARAPCRRPNTADVYSQPSPISPLTLLSAPSPPALCMPSSVEQPRYEVRSYSTSPAPSPVAKAGRSSNTVDAASRSTTSRLLRARVASTPKLRLNASSLFPSEQRFHEQPPVPPLPGQLADGATGRRPSTAQSDGREPFLGRRFRSRTLGETDRAEAAKMQAAVHNAAHRGQEISASQRPALAAGLASTAIPQRHASRTSATSSDLHSPLYMQPTPGSSICSASSPATTNSSLPVTPGLTATFPRPKSRGTGMVVKSAGGAGWASYLNSGLSLHLEQDHGRAFRVNMSYLAYDPFGRPEQLVDDTEVARALTPKRPKSRGDKDQEAEQSGTLEFGPTFEDGRDAILSLDMLRRSDESVLLKHLTVGEDTKADLLTRQAALSLRTLGHHQVSGYERKGRLAWKFAYRVEQDGPWPDRRRLVPVRFSCSATLLDPERARKSRLLNLVKKQMVPTLASKAVSSTVQDAPCSPSRAYDLCANGTAAASPASSRRSNKQLAAELPLPVSPIRLNINSGNHASPLRQASSNGFSTLSIGSADSSYCSQPTTPGRDRISAGKTSRQKMHLEASPVNAHFGQASPGSHHRRPIAANSATVPSLDAPALQLDLGSSEASRNLQQKVSMNSLSASSLSSGSVQMAKPVIINGRKLIPISLPAGLARKSKIDPALLQANVISSPQRGVPPVSGSSASGDRQRSTSMHSSASSSNHSHRRALNEETSSIQCLLSNTPRSANGAATSSSRPPTASETIKMEYLARTAESAEPARQQLRQQRSFVGAVLTPSSFADASRQRRQRSRTVEGREPHRRPFTADAWGESQYPSWEQISTVRAISQQHHTDDRKIIPREVLANFGMVSRERSGGEAYKPLPAPPRPQSRPRTAQTITAADTGGAASFNILNRGAFAVSS